MKQVRIVYFVCVIYSIPFYSLMHKYSPSPKLNTYS